MVAIVGLLALAILGICAYGVAAPQAYADFGRRIMAGLGIGGAVALRFALGGALWLAADSSATPTAFRVLGTLTLAGAVAAPLIGAARIDALISWSAARPAFVRASCGAGVVLGLFLLWSCIAGPGT